MVGRKGLENALFAPLYLKSDDATKKLRRSAYFSLQHHGVAHEPVIPEEDIEQTTLSCYVQRFTEVALLDSTGNPIHYYYDDGKTIRVYPYVRLHNLSKHKKLDLKFPDCLIDHPSNSEFRAEVVRVLQCETSVLNLLNLIELKSHFSPVNGNKPLEAMFDLPTRAFKFCDFTGYPNELKVRTKDHIYKSCAYRFKLTKNGQVFTRETETMIIYYSDKSQAYKSVHANDKLRLLLDLNHVRPRANHYRMFNNVRKLNKAIRGKLPSIPKRTACNDCNTLVVTTRRCAACNNMVCFECTDKVTRSLCLDCRVDKSITNVEKINRIAECKPSDVDVIEVIAGRIASDKSVAPLEVYKETSASAVDIRLGYFIVNETRYYYASNKFFWTFLNDEPVIVSCPDQINILQDFAVLSKLNRGTKGKPETAKDEYFKTFSLHDFRSTQQAPDGYFKLDGRIIYRGPEDQFWTSDGELAHEKTSKEMFAFAARKTNVPIGTTPPVDGVSSYGFWNEHSSSELIKQALSKFPDYVDNNSDVSEPYTESITSSVSEIDTRLGDVIDSESSSMTSSTPDVEFMGDTRVFGSKGGIKTKLGHCSKRLKFTQRSAYKYDYDVPDLTFISEEIKAILLLTAILLVFAISLCL